MATKVRTLYYMKLDKVMTEINLFSDGTISFNNFSDNPVDCAFTYKKAPIGIRDLNIFLESRCFPEDRFDSKELLKSLGLEVYEPMSIVKITHGVMFDDMYWIRFDDEKITYKELRTQWGLN